MEWKDFWCNHPSDAPYVNSAQLSRLATYMDSCYEHLASVQKQNY